LDEKYVLGIDSGTESVRVGLFDLRGRPLAYASREYPTFYPHPGWAEQDAESIWKCTCLAIRELLRNTRISQDSIVGIGADGTTSTVGMADEKNRVLRKLILWSDVRAASQAARITETHHEVLKYIGGVASAEGMTAKALWLKENEPDLWHKARRVFETTDYLTFKMTGRWTASIFNASVRWNYVSTLNGWREDFFEQIGLKDVLEKWPEEVLSMGELQGELTEEAAEEMGLRAGIPVAQGGTDAAAGMIGLGACTPGRLALILGSSSVLLANREKPYFAKHTIMLPDAVVKGLWLWVGGEASTGSVIRWFKDQFCFEENEEAKRKNMRIYELLDKKAAEVQLGSNGIIVLQHWQGSRVYLDPLSRGVIWGLTLASTKAQIYRAILEGCAYSTKLSIDTNQDMDFDGMWVCGGGARSEFFLQIHADVCNLPVYLTEVPEAVCLGSAMLGAVAAGCYKDVFEAAENMVHIKQKIEPDKNNNKQYEFYYRMYRETYSHMKDLIHQVAEHHIHTNKT